MGYQESSTQEVEVDDSLFHMYVAAALWILILYVVGMSMWIYLQAVDGDMDQLFYRSFMKDHCRDQSQLPSPAQIARFTVDGSIDFKMIPAEASVYKSENNFYGHPRRNADMSIGSGSYISDYRRET
ncbi:hypothetical protein GE061_018768 [Apolygus lucorum]|uniref:Uncharacterized protein n=1 Tax=Apolygus lucorum TaxID=248454 RepID=A0A6A4JG19_APOLU|nr:hypothetical protein GE061_018768 [Apolygus lucorum]